jgi:hypothetical protein
VSDLAYKNMDDDLYRKNVVRNEDHVTINGYRPATVTEIKNAHPKCGWCVSCNLLDQSGEGICTNADSNSCGMIVDVFTDYCRHCEIEI